MNLVYIWPHSPGVLHSSVVERPPSVWEVIGLNPVGGSDFFSLSHTRDMLIILSSQCKMYNG